jgi:hypothetical protein
VTGRNEPLQKHHPSGILPEDSEALKGAAPAARASIDPVVIARSLSDVAISGRLNPTFLRLEIASLRSQ